MDDSEPKCAALRESAVERLKETVEILRRNPDAFVLDSHDHVASRVVHGSGRVTSMRTESASAYFCTLRSASRATR